MTARDEASVPDPRLGQTVGGKYVLESVLGRGGMGSVYAARHAALGTKVAIKVMHEGMTRDAMFVERFNREAQAASRLDHPNVIRVIDFGRDTDDLLYTVMDFAGGSDLGETIARDAPLGDRRIVEILGQVLSAIAAAHDVGIVHRDLKPENIIMSVRVDDDGNRLDVARVCDFGIAQIADGNKADGSGRALTLSGTLLGTPQYMPPEQCRGEPLDARADLYSVGVILYQLLTGRLPFDAENPIDVVVKHISEEPLPPSQIRADVSPGLEAVCLCALQKRKENRYPSARAMRAALRDAVPDSFVSSPGPTRLGSGSLRATSKAPDSQDTGFAPPTLVSPHGLRAPSPEPEAKRGSVASAARMRPLRVTLGLGLLLLAVIPGAFAFQRSRAISESRSAAAAASPIPALALVADHAPE